MPQTPNKGYEVQTTGTNSGTWGQVLNDDMISIVDSNLGGIVSKSLSSSNVVLSATESQALILRLTGTLTANVQVTTSCAGMTIVENLTSGAFSVTFTNGVGTPVTLTQGIQALIITDTTNGPRIAAVGLTVTAAGAALLDDADATAQRATLGLVIGTDVQAFNANYIKSNTTSTLSAGYNANSFNAGTKSSGTFTPDPTNGNFQFAINSGAHTLAPPSSTCSIVIQYTNNASAGTVTTSGFTKVTGDTITTTNGDDFLFYIVRDNGFSHLNVVALQ